jgi:hypothetical protein
VSQVSPEGQYVPAAFAGVSKGFAVCPLPGISRIVVFCCWRSG